MANSRTEAESSPLTDGKPEQAVTATNDSWRGVGTVIGGTAQAVIFLFAAFHGYLSELAPPAPIFGGIDAREAAGFASFVSLLVFLLAKLWMRASVISPRKWRLIVTAISFLFVAVSVVYFNFLIDRTLVFEAESGKSARQVVGTIVTPEYAGHVEVLRTKKRREPLPEEILENAGNDLRAIRSIWTPASTRHAHNFLVLLYAAMVALLALSLAMAAEALLVESELRPTSP